MCGEEEKINTHTEQVFLVVWVIPKIVAPSCRNQG